MTDPSIHPNARTKALVDETDASFYSVETTASSWECTGLMPAMPIDEEGKEHLSELYAIHCPPGSIEEDPAHAGLRRADARPCDAPSPQKTTPTPRQAITPDQYRQGQGRIRAKVDPQRG